MTLLQDLDQQGYAIVPGLFSSGEIAEIALAFDHLAAIARTLDGPADVGGARFVVDPAPFRIHRVVWCGGADPVLARYAADPRLSGLAAEVLGVDPVAHLVQQAHFKLPGDGVGFGWHQDASNRRYGTDLWTDLDGRGSFIQIALAVDPQGADNGGLQVLPGTHRLGFVADPQTGALPPDLDLRSPVDVVLAPGDAVVFGPFLVHGSAPNRSDGPRRLLIQGFAIPGANRRIYPGCGQGVLRSPTGGA